MSLMKKALLGKTQSRKRVRFAAVMFAVAFVPGVAQAMTTLKQVQVSGGSQIDLLFDGKVGKSQIRTEFFNDVIQISLTDVAVYPAKISSVNGGSLVKIFAYQYAPKLVRCRLTVKGKAEDFKDRLQVSANGKVMTLKLSDGNAASDQVAMQAAQANRVAPKEGAEKSADKAKASGQEHDIKNNAEETALLEKVLKSSPSREREKDRDEKKEAAAEKRSEKKGDKADKSEKNERQLLAGGKPLPSPLGIVGKLLLVIGLFGAIAMAAKKFMRFRNGGARQLNARIARGEGGWMSALGGIARNAASGLGRKDKMIEVLSNHYLGPKKSIAVVRVMGRTLVLGVTNESINLISQISDENSDFELDALFGGAANDGAPSLTQPRVEAAAAKAKAAATALPGKENYPHAGANAAGPSAFSSMLSAEAKKPAPGSNVRNQIRSRLEGLKQL